MLGTTLLWRSTVAFIYLKVKSAKCLCLLPVVLVLRIWSCLQHCQILVTCEICSLIIYFTIIHVLIRNGLGRWQCTTGKWRIKQQGLKKTQGPGEKPFGFTLRWIKNGKWRWPCGVYRTRGSTKLLQRFYCKHIQYNITMITVRKASI